MFIKLQTTLKLKNKFQLLKESRKNLKKRGNKLFTKGVYLSELSFFLLLKKESNMNRFQIKKKNIFYAYPV